MHKKKEAVKSEDKVQEDVIVKVQGEQDFTEEIGRYQKQERPEKVGVWRRLQEAQPLTVVCYQKVLVECQRGRIERKGT